MSEFRQEADVVPGKTIMGILIGVLGAIAGFVLLAWGIESCRTAEVREGALPVEKSPLLPPEVNAMELTTFEEEAQGLEANQAESRRLQSYGWVDRETGVVHIPIEDAFEIYLQRQKEGGR